MVAIGYHKNQGLSKQKLVAINHTVWFLKCIYQAISGLLVSLQNVVFQTDFCFLNMINMVRFVFEYVVFFFEHSLFCFRIWFVLF